MKKALCFILSLAVCAFVFSGCGAADSEGRPKKKAVKRESVESTQLQFAAPKTGDLIAVFDTSAGEIRAVLYPQYAPMAVKNFTGLCESGYYNGTSFHRVIYGFAVQGGDASGTGQKGATIWDNQPFPAEFSSQLHHYAGALCAARSPEDTTSTTSQFYFVQALQQPLEDSLKAQLEQAGIDASVIEAYDAAGGLAYLDYTDTVFGQIYQGMDVVDEIARVDTDEQDRPLEDVILNSVTISSYISE